MHGIWSDIIVSSSKTYIKRRVRMIFYLGYICVSEIVNLTFFLTDKSLFKPDLNEILDCSILIGAANATWYGALNF